MKSFHVTSTLSSRMKVYFSPKKKLNGKFRTKTEKKNVSIVLSSSHRKPKQIKFLFFQRLKKEIFITFPNFLMSFSSSFWLYTLFFFWGCIINNFYFIGFLPIVFIRYLNWWGEQTIEIMKNGLIESDGNRKRSHEKTQKKIFLQNFPIWK